MQDHRINHDQLARAKGYQRGAAQMSAIARQAFEAGDYAKAKWYQLEAEAEYRGARGLVDAILRRGFTED